MSGTIALMVMLSGCATKEKKVSLPLPVSSTPVCNDQNSTNALYSSSLPQEEDAELSLVTKKVSDLDYYPQSIAVYLENNSLEFTPVDPQQNNFEESYYRPWFYTVAPICVSEVQWPIKAYKSGYGSNLKPYPSEWFVQLELESNFQSFGSVNKPAISTRWLDLRVMPTARPLYRNPAIPGEGYPFDHFQNSSVASNEPLFLSHYSKDGGWAYVFTNNASGWVESSGIALINRDQISKIKTSKKLFVTEDKVPLYDISGKFLLYSRIGMVLGLQEEKSDQYLSYYYDASGLKTVVVPKSAAQIGVQPITKEKLQKISTYMLQNTYGWGGMFEERDCSSMIRDMFTPFGIWLPRNSSMQAKRGEVISFNGLDNAKKIALIKERGVPFETILYKKGHVLLYIGTYNGTVMAMHNIWGIRTIDKTGKKGREIVGKTVISSLELGSDVENFDPDHMLLTTLVSMNIFTRPANQSLLVKSSKP